MSQMAQSDAEDFRITLGRMPRSRTWRGMRDSLLRPLLFVALYSDLVDLGSANGEFFRQGIKQLIVFFRDKELRRGGVEFALEFYGRLCFDLGDRGVDADVSRLIGWTQIGLRLWLGLRGGGSPARGPGSMVCSDLAGSDAAEAASAFVSADFAFLQSSRTCCLAPVGTGHISRATDCSHSS